MVRRGGKHSRIPVRSADDLVSMRKAGRVVALALKKIGETIRPGLTTLDLDEVAANTIRGLGAEPAFLGYNGFPATACISINAEVVHGIPSTRRINDGDIVSVDLGAIVDGWYADAAYTFGVGDVSADAQRLMETGIGALAAGVAAAQAGQYVRDIGRAVQQYAEARGAAVVRDLCGHGIGRRLHEEPQIPNYVSTGGNLELRSGMTLAIEPMLNAGDSRVLLQDDNWTFVSVDGSLSVHYEHTVLVHGSEPEILTTLR